MVRVRSHRNDSAFSLRFCAERYPPLSGICSLGINTSIPGEQSQQKRVIPTIPLRLSCLAKYRGIGTALTYNFDSHWGGEVDFGYNRDKNSATAEWTASAGPRFMWRSDSGANLFLHALVSFNRLTSDGSIANSNGIGAILGGGMDIAITKRVSWRLFQADYVWARHNYANEAAPQFARLASSHPGRRAAAHRTCVQLGRRGAGATRCRLLRPAH